MGLRGPRSTQSLAVVDAAGAGLSRVERPRAPSELTAEQAAEWRAVVDRMPAEWFGRETHAMLAQYCRHAVAARRVAQLIADAETGDDFDVEQYDRLLKMQEREGRAMSSLATRMRFSQQSAYDKSKKRQNAAPRPWERAANG